MSLNDLNFLAVIGAGVIYFVLGALWYSPLLFAKPFIKYRGMTEEEIRNSGDPREFAMAFVAALISAFTVAVVIQLAGAETFVDGVAVGLLCALGLAITSSLTFTVFSGPHKMLWVIYSGYQLVAFALMGILLALWQ